MSENPGRLSPEERQRQIEAGRAKAMADWVRRKIAEGKRLRARLRRLAGDMADLDPSDPDIRMYRLAADEADAWVKHLEAGKPPPAPEMPNVQLIIAIGNQDYKNDLERFNEGQRQFKGGTTE